MTDRVCAAYAPQLVCTGLPVHLYSSLAYLFALMIDRSTTRAVSMETGAESARAVLRRWPDSVCRYQCVFNDVSTATVARDAGPVADPRGRGDGGYSPPPPPGRFS